MQTRKQTIQLKPFACFLILVFVCIGSSMAGQMFFPGDNVFPYLIRTSLTAAGTIILAIGSERLLKRTGGKLNDLGLGCSTRSIVGFFAGCAGGLLVVAVLGAALWVVAAFHFESGALDARRIPSQVIHYFWSNSGEELVFRGYLLIVLSRALGLKTALIVIALMFGLFHLPGLTGIQALKMVCTTAASSYLFSAVFLYSGTLWTAIGLHLGMNVALHTISGLDGGTALLKPVFVDRYPQQYDPGFWIMGALPLILAGILFRRAPRSPP